MKVVEVDSWFKNRPNCIDALNDLSRAFGHRPVVAKDTLDLYINHAGRAYGTEALKS